MQVIEVDGVLTKPLLVKKVYLAAGQRISVLVKTKDSKKLNYYMHANMDEEMFDYVPDGLQMSKYT